MSLFEWDEQAAILCCTVRSARLHISNLRCNTSTHNLHSTYQKLFARCTKFEPRQRPEISEVAAELKKMCEALERRSKRGGADKPASVPLDISLAKKEVRGGSVAANPWKEDSATTAALRDFVSKLTNAEERKKLEEFQVKAEALLGAAALDPLTGIFNAARLLRFLKSAEMDLNDAMGLLAMSTRERTKHGVDAKRKRIVVEDLSFNTIPRAEEAMLCTLCDCWGAGEMEHAQWLHWLSAHMKNHHFCSADQPENMFVGRAKDRRVITYFCVGSTEDLARLKKAFSVEEYVELKLFGEECSRMILDAICASERMDVAYACFYDWSGGSLGGLLGALEYAQTMGQVKSGIFPAVAGTVVFNVNFPVFWRVCLDMYRRGTGTQIPFEFYDNAATLDKEATVVDAVDLSLLPKAIGGKQSSTDKDGKEDDKFCCGVIHPTISEVRVCSKVEGANCLCFAKTHAIIYTVMHCVYVG